MTQAGFKKSGDIAFWSQYTYQAFSAPPIFNIDRLISLAKARVDAAGDHLWLLQTDPAYMRRHMRQISEFVAVKRAGRSDSCRIIVGELCHDLQLYWFWQSVVVELHEA
ncbi:hypothetical protein NA57DRAFT_77841 [Rhizodiscina lignyota]|uniref:Uncharacterized protein n=1 Tax=Rhizodiscina lignyota TaxID=1504668 RepID=A0A9P4IBC6_9PEZI|nr:hypothetical protein NA57DRAFT_77841 [Rhizodiscina lignyota]